MKGIYARATNSADYLQKRCVWTKAVMEQSVTTSSEELLAEYGHAQNGTVFRYWTCDKKTKQNKKKRRQIDWSRVHLFGKIMTQNTGTTELHARWPWKDGKPSQSLDFIQLVWVEEK